MEQTGERLLELLSHFAEQMDWLGMRNEDLAQITEWTLKQLRTYLELYEPQANMERNTIEEAIEIVQTFMPDLL